MARTMSLEVASLIRQARREHKQILLPAPEPAFVDSRGAITNLVSGAPLAHAALITCNRGAIRGNHYHPKEGGDQYIYVLRGKLEAYSQALPKYGSSERTRLVASDGDLLYCPVEVAHAYLALEPTRFLAIDGAARGPDRYELTTCPWVILGTP